jgi:hypothetical protein
MKRLPLGKWFTPDRQDLECFWAAKHSADGKTFLLVFKPDGSANLVQYQRWLPYCVFIALECASVEDAEQIAKETGKFCEIWHDGKFVKDVGKREPYTSIY